MPQYRKLHVELTESFDLDAMPDDFARLLWVMLPLGLDREGRGLDNASWVKAKLMPLRTDVTLEQVEAALTWYAERGLIRRYAVEGRRYFWASSFGEQQGNTAKEAPSRIPPPPTVTAALDSSASPDHTSTDTEARPDSFQTNSTSGPITDVDIDAITTPPGGGSSSRDPSSETDATLEDDEHIALTGLQRPFLELVEASCYAHPTQAMTTLALDLLQTDSRPGPITDVDVDIDSDSDSDADAEKDAGDGAPASSSSSSSGEPERNTEEEKPKRTLRPVIAILPCVTRERMHPENARPERAGGGERAPPPRRCK